MRVARIIGEGEGFYHILSRIVDRRLILDDTEKERFRSALSQELRCKAPDWRQKDAIRPMEWTVHGTAFAARPRDSVIAWRDTAMILALLCNCAYSSGATILRHAIETDRVRRDVISGKVISKEIIKDGYDYSKGQGNT